MASPARGMTLNFSEWSKFGRKACDHGRLSHKTCANSLGARQDELEELREVGIGIKGDEDGERGDGVKGETVADLSGHGLDLKQIALERFVSSVEAAAESWRIGGDLRRG